jgi:hypothetical protein
MYCQHAPLKCKAFRDASLTFQAASSFESAKNPGVYCLVRVALQTNAGTNWTSGALYDNAARSALLATEQSRLQALRNDAALPLVYFDVAIKGKPAGRIHFVLFTKQSPRAAENFRQLCTGAEYKSRRRRGA